MKKNQRSSAPTIPNKGISIQKCSNNNKSGKKKVKDEKIQNERENKEASLALLKKKRQGIM